MHTSDLFGEVRSLLHGPPSLEAWRALWSLLGTVPEALYERDLKAYVLAQSARWPDALRVYIPHDDVLSRSLEAAVTLHKGSTRDLADLQALDKASSFKRLDISRGTTRYQDSSMASWQEALKPGPWFNVEHLRVSYERWGSEHRSILEQGAHWPALKHLALEHMHLPKEFFARWLECEHLMALDGLSLKASRSSARSLGRVLGSDLPGWTRLNLNTTDPPPFVIAQLAGSALSRQLVSLELERALMREDVAEHLNALPWGSLEHLLVSQNSVTGVATWLSPSNLPALRSLVARSMTGRGVLIGHSALLGQLHQLDMSFNQHNVGLLLDTGMFTAPLPQLRSLRLRGSLPRKHAGAFLKRLQTPNLRRLDLSNNTLSHEAVRSLASNPTLDQLEVLELNNCELSYTHVLDLCHSPFIRGLHRLELSGNPIDGIGQNALQHADLLSPEAKRSLTR